MEGSSASGQVTQEDQRSFIKIESIRGKNPTQIYESLREVCGDSTMDRSTISRWAKRFRSGQMSIEDDKRSGRPKTATDNTSAATNKDR